MGRCSKHAEPRFDCETCSTAARLGQAVEYWRVELVPQTLIDVFDDEVQEVLDAIGYPDAPVTDTSCIGDFQLEWRHRRSAETRLGMSLQDGDYVYEVAQRLRELER